MIYVADLIRRGDEHRTTNLPTLKALAETGLISHLWISSDSTSFRDLDLNQDASTTLIKVNASKKYRWITSTLLTLFILWKSRITSTNAIFLSTTPLQNLLISYFSKFTKNRCKYFIYVHGELSYLIEPNGIGRLLGKYFLDLAFRIANINNTIHITLAYPVYKKIIDTYKYNKKIRNLEIPTDQSTKKTSLFYTKKLRIGSFGVHCADKNSQLIYELADLLKDNRDAIEIVTIGTAHKDFEYDKNPFVTHLCRGDASSALIPRNTFIEHVCSLDIALIFYGSSPKYEYVSSGVFNDCVNHCLPFVALESQYLQYYIEKYGEMGLIGSNLTELSKKIIEISNNKEKINFFKNNINNLNKELQYSNFKNNLLSIINE